MNVPTAYIGYLIEFQATRDLFECHELLEEYWKENPKDPLADTWVGLIQLAVGLYHQRRGNDAGARKMLLQAELRLSECPLGELGIDKTPLIAELSARRKTLEGTGKKNYTDMNLQITDHELLAHCKELCVRKGLVWERPSPMDDEPLIHRHKLRDRTEVIAARRASYEAKLRERGRDK